MPNPQLSIEELIEHCNRKCSQYERLAPYNYDDYSLHSLIYLEHHCTRQYLQELQHYKQLEEQGLLLKLPCAVNDIVYLLLKNAKKIRKCQVERFNVHSFGITLQIFIFEDKRSVQIDADRFGELVFLTKAEAEKALADMKGE